jgi:hypothetical protein
MPPIYSIITNPMLKCSNSSSLIKFQNSIEKHNIDLSQPNSFMFSWHGTQSKTNIESICSHGFDPKLRKTQTFGYGEYFGYTSSISRAYCGTTHYLILSVLLTGPWLSNHQNFCYIVDNPICNQNSYVLPLLIVNFGKEDALNFK